MGAELIGDASPAADAEMIAMLVEALLNAGLTEFQVSVGQVDFFKGLCEQAGLDMETELELRSFISSRNEFGAQELLEHQPISDDVRDALLRVSSFFGSYEILEDALACAGNERSKKAIERLKEIYGILQTYGVEQYVSFDLAMVSKYHYYTGVIFNAYTYQTGSAIAKGGRYDRLLEKFGKPSPATGFVVIIDDLVAALTRQKRCPALENKNILLVYEGDIAAAIIEAKAYREQGYDVVLLKLTQEKKRYTEFAQENGFERIVYI